MDKLSPEQRHKNMSAIRSKDTKPEMIVRKWLWGRGFRYRLNSPKLPGHPDLVLRKYRTCIFVNGCFWHGHERCCRIPKTNREFWVAKIRRNQERDIEPMSPSRPRELSGSWWKHRPNWVLGIPSISTKSSSRVPDD